MLIARSRRLVWTAASRRLEAQGDSMVAWQLLNRLHQTGPMAQCELAASVGQHPAGVSRLLDVLARGRLVAQRRDAADRRRLLVDLTRAGRARLESMQPHIAHAADEAMERLGPADRRMLKAILEKLLAGTDLAPRGEPRGAHARKDDKP